MTRTAERHIDLVTITGSKFCVAIDDGNKVHEQIAAALDEKQPVIVSFKDVRRLTTAFLNAAIGQLYNEYEEAFIREYMRVEHASQEDLKLLKRVVDNAKTFFSDARRRSEVRRSLLGDE